MGRPSIFTPELAAVICARLAEGESLRSICRDDEMPGTRTVFEWLESDEDFRAKYARARAVQAEVMVDEIVEIADDGTNDFMERRRRDGSVEIAFDPENVRRSALRVSARQWYAEKLLPKKYGARTVLAGDPDAPLAFEKIERVIVDPKK